jgi:hypothetical protein
MLHKKSEKEKTKKVKSRKKILRNVYSTQVVSFKVWASIFAFFIHANGIYLQETPWFKCSTIEVQL